MLEQLPQNTNLQNATLFPLGKAARRCQEGATQVGAEKFYTPAVRGELLEMYLHRHEPLAQLAASADPRVSRIPDCQVAVHIDTGEVWSIRKIDNAKIAAALAKDFANKKICIFAKEKESDFHYFDRVPAEVQIMTGFPVKVVFENLVSAQELVMSKNSFSYVAGVLSRGRVSAILECRPKFT